MDLHVQGPVVLPHKPSPAHRTNERPLLGMDPQMAPERQLVEHLFANRTPVLGDDLRLRRLRNRVPMQGPVEENFGRRVGREGTLLAGVGPLRLPGETTRLVSEMDR